MTSCKITLFHLPRVGVAGSGRGFPKCGQPVVKYGLCATHYADRIRLGGSE